MKTYKHWTMPFLFLISACAPTPKPAEEVPTNKVISVAKRKAQTETVSSWNINGAMAAKNKSKAWSASMNWMQNGPNKYQIRLIGPLGGGTVLINKSGDTITFEDGTKKSASTNAEKLLLKETGISLPVNNLYFWVRGLPAPGKTQAEQHDKYNHLTQLEQNGYVIDFTKFTSINGVDLPSIIRLEGQGVLIKVIIKSWGK